MSSKKAEEYDPNFYVDLFKGTVYSESYSSSDFIFIKNGEITTLPKNVVQLLELLFDKNLIDHSNDECNDKKSKFLSDIIKEYANDPNKIYEYYLKLNTKIRGSWESNYISNYMSRCNNTKHSEYNIKVLKIFRISRSGEFAKYKEIKEKIKNKKLLFYGAPLQHYASILSKGLEMTSNQSEPPTNPSHNGFYFTDTIVEALKFCEIDKNKIGVVLLAEVAIGNTYKVTENETVAQLPNGKNSVKLYGKYQYDSTSYTKTNTGVRVSSGVIRERNVTTVFPYNRYIVYNPNQIQFQFLVQFECELKEKKN